MKIYKEGHKAEKEGKGGEIYSKEEKDRVSLSSGFDTKKDIVGDTHRTSNV